MIDPVLNKNRIFWRLVQTLYRLPKRYPLEIKLANLILASGISYAFIKKFPRSIQIKLGSSAALVYLVYQVGQHILHQSQMEKQKREVMGEHTLKLFRTKQRLLLLTAIQPPVAREKDNPPPSPPQVQDFPPSSGNPQVASCLSSIAEFQKS